MKSSQIIDLIKKEAPECISCSWDNTGLMSGDLDSEVTKIMLTLDVTPDVVNQAVSKGCEMIVSHHPMIFKPIKSIDYSTPFGDMLRKILANNITVYSCHTNMDGAINGINAVLAKMYELDDIKILEPHQTYTDTGIGRIGKLKNPMSIAQLCEKTKELLNTPFVRLTAADASVEVSEICVASGSCGDLISLAASKGAELIITADVKYHEALDAVIPVVDAGHFPTEYHVVDIFEKILSSAPVKIFKAEAADVFKIL